MKTIKIGRGSNNDVVIKDDVVSTYHAILTVSDLGEVSIKDLNSTNGTFVDGKKITEAKLSSSSTVVLGSHSIDWKQMVLGSVSKPITPKNPIIIPPTVVEKKIIGRGVSSNIRFAFDEVSDQHAFLCKQKDGSILLIDNNSTNGTFVNGQRITTPYILHKGDNVTIAKRHTLNWETIYSDAKPWFRILKPIAIVVAIIIGVIIAQPWKWDVFNFEKDWTEIYAEHKNDVVFIWVKYTYAVTIQGRPLSDYIKSNSLDYVYLRNGDIEPGIGVSSGTGFFISNDGKFLTNKHVVGSMDDERKAEEYIKKQFQDLFRANGQYNWANNLDVSYTVVSVSIGQNDTHITSENDLIPCTVLKESDNDDLDVALVQVNSKKIPVGSTCVDLTKTIHSQDLKIGQAICTIGFPKGLTIGDTESGLEANNQSGEITQERGRYVYGHNITIHQGASGSPVYNKKGQFAGIIVSGYLGISQGYNHAIHPTPIIEFVNKY